MNDKPPQVKQALILLWVGFLLGPIRLALNWKLVEAVLDDFIAASILAATLILSVLLIWKISQGKNWARITYLVLFLIGVPVGLYQLAGDFGVSVLNGSIAVLQIVLPGVALFLISRGAAKDWFTQGYTEPSLPSIKA